MEDIGTYLSVAFGLVGTIVGYLQNRQKVQFQKIVRANSWFNFQRANNSNGSLQIAIDTYKNKHQDSIDPEVIELLSKSDAFGQEVYKESIRQIHFSEPSFKRTDIEMWQEDGKISEKDKKFFSWLAESGPKKRCITIMLAPACRKTRASCERG